MVLGVSGDSVERHQKFKDKYNLPFTLIADTDHAICQAYGVWSQKSMFGKKYMGIDRTTFIIDGDGKVAKVFENVNPLGHAGVVEKAVAAVQHPRA